MISQISLLVNDEKMFKILLVAILVCALIAAFAIYFTGTDLLSIAGRCVSSGDGNTVCT